MRELAGRKLASIPVAPKREPALGHLVPLLRDPLTFLSNLPRYGPLVRIHLGTATAVVVCDPGMTRHVLRDDRSFDKGGPFYARAREIAGNGLGSCPYGDHRRQRRLIQPAFHSQRLPGYAQVMTRVATEVTGSWCDEEILDLPREMFTVSSRVLLDMIGADAHSSSARGHMLTDVSTLFAGMYRRMLLPAPLGRLPTSGNRRYLRARARLRGILAGIVTDRRPRDSDQGDLLSALLRVSDPGNEEKKFSESELVDQLLTFFVAGTETVASTLAWAMYLLDQHPDIDQKLYAETSGVLDGSAARYEHLPELELVSRVVTETLRLYPPGWLFTRVTTTDVRLGVYDIPRGTHIVYSPYLVHHDRDIYSRPEYFDPDRWDGNHKPSSESFIPFGGGARKCIGSEFALTEVTLALATIVSRWRLQGVSGQYVRPALGVSLSPRALRVRAIARRW
ncbi:pentalenene oxygenase [Actinopolyspora xinjiangensis]|uniref:Pentalenene oxygenase n=1 Tax=Actinopolyspora xinjiangensis TaxID=405564 RepID=A0A1H0WZ54_9ACTN|nr:cytochrome P450 [Actinopolyspora xinjiangensis]SDP95869.1 pentalenene oxygenase [Actinopolyspora xinjiangensis]